MGSILKKTILIKALMVVFALGLICFSIESYATKICCEGPCGDCCAALGKVCCEDGEGKKSCLTHCQGDCPPPFCVNEEGTCCPYCPTSCSFGYCMYFEDGCYSCRPCIFPPAPNQCPPGQVVVRTNPLKCCPPDKRCLNINDECVVCEVETETTETGTDPCPPIAPCLECEVEGFDENNCPICAPIIESCDPCEDEVWADGCLTCTPLCGTCEECVDNSCVSRMTTKPTGDCCDAGNVACCSLTETCSCTPIDDCTETETGSGTGPECPPFTGCPQCYIQYMDEDDCPACAEEPDSCNPCEELVWEDGCLKCKPICKECETCFDNACVSDCVGCETCVDGICVPEPEPECPCDPAVYLGDGCWGGCPPCCPEVTCVGCQTEGTDENGCPICIDAPEPPCPCGGAAYLGDGCWGGCPSCNCEPPCAECQYCDDGQCYNINCDANKCKVCIAGRCESTCTGDDICCDGVCMNNKCDCPDYADHPDCNNKCEGVVCPDLCTECVPKTGECTIDKNASCDECSACNPADGECVRDEEVYNQKVAEAKANLQANGYSLARPNCEPPLTVSSTVRKVCGVSFFGYLCADARSFCSYYRYEGNMPASPCYEDIFLPMLNYKTPWLTPSIEGGSGLGENTAQMHGSGERVWWGRHYSTIGISYLGASDSCYGSTSQIDACCPPGERVACTTDGSDNTCCKFAAGIVQENAEGELEPVKIRCEIPPRSGARGATPEQQNRETDQVCCGYDDPEAYSHPVHAYAKDGKYICCSAGRVPTDNGDKCCPKDKPNAIDWAKMTFADGYFLPKADKGFICCEEEKKSIAVYGRRCTIFAEGIKDYSFFDFTCCETENITPITGAPSGEDYKQCCPKYAKDQTVTEPVADTAQEAYWEASECEPAFGESHCCTGKVFELMGVGTGESGGYDCCVDIKNGQTPYGSAPSDSDYAPEGEDIARCCPRYLSTDDTVKEAKAFWNGANMACCQGAVFEPYGAGTGPTKGFACCVDAKGSSTYGQEVCDVENAVADGIKSSCCPKYESVIGNVETPTAFNSDGVSESYYNPACCNGEAFHQSNHENGEYYECCPNNWCNYMGGDCWYDDMTSANSQEQADALTEMGYDCYQYDENYWDCSRTPIIEPIEGKITPITGAKEGEPDEMCCGDKSYSSKRLENGSNEFMSHDLAGAYRSTYCYWGCYTYGVCCYGTIYQQLADESLDNAYTCCNEWDNKSIVTVQGEVPSNRESKLCCNKYEKNGEMVESKAFYDGANPRCCSGEVYPSYANPSNWVCCDKNAPKYSWTNENSRGYGCSLGEPFKTCSTCGDYEVLDASGNCTPCPSGEYASWPSDCQFLDVEGLCVIAYNYAAEYHGISTYTYNERTYSYDYVCPRGASWYHSSGLCCKTGIQTCSYRWCEDEENQTGCWYDEIELCGEYSCW